jgi:hypothetical protein
MQQREIQLNPVFTELISSGWVPLSSATDLATIDDNLSSSSYVFAANTSYALTVENKSSAQMLDLNYFLVNNIDLSSIANWTPLGTFTGELDGKGYNISNLTISSTNTSTQGLFTIINNGSVKNLTILDAKVTININLNSTYSNFGILTGILQGTSSIQNLNILRLSSNSSFLKASFGNFTGNRSSRFGAIAGFVTGNITINNINVDTNISALDSTGGFIGEAQDLTTLTISNSRFTGNLLKQSNAVEVVNNGGIIGAIFSTGNINIINVSVETDLLLGYLSNENRVITVGGIIGVLREQAASPNAGPILVISQSSFKGNLSGAGNVGKFIGSIYNRDAQNVGSIEINDSYGIGNIISNGYGAGHISGANRIGTTRTLTVNRVYVVGNVESVSADKTRLGYLFGTNGDNNSTGAGTITTNNVYYSSFSTYSQNFVRGQMCGGAVTCDGIRPGLATLTGTSGLTDNNLKTQSSFNTWNFASIWRINPNKNNGYPYLAWQD